VSSDLDGFWKGLPFAPDDFQVEAGEAIADGQ